MARKSPREIESAVEKLEEENTPDSADDEREERLAEARERWEADAYEPGDVDRIQDAYLLTADGYEWGDAFMVTWRWVANIRNRFGAPDIDLPEFPTEDVVEAWLTFGDEVGINGHGLRDRHGEDWPRWYFESLYFEMERARYKRLDPDGEKKMWELNRDKVEENIREWRAAYQEAHP